MTEYKRVNNIIKADCTVCGTRTIHCYPPPETIINPCNDCRMTPFEKKLKQEIEDYPLGATMDIIAEELSKKYGLDKVKLYHWPRGGVYEAGMFADVEVN